MERRCALYWPNKEPDGIPVLYLFINFSVKIFPACIWRWCYLERFAMWVLLLDTKTIKRGQFSKAVLRHEMYTYNTYGTCNKQWQYGLVLLRIPPILSQLFAGCSFRSSGGVSGPPPHRTLWIWGMLKLLLSYPLLLKMSLQ